MQQITMPFDNKSVEVVCDGQGNPWVGVRSVCDAVGIQSNRQIGRLMSNPSYKVITYVITSAGGPQETACIPLNQLNGWLFSINPNKVPEQ